MFITQNKRVYKALREIKYKGWELMLKILYLGRLKSTSFIQNNCISHLVGNYALNPPLVSVNTLTSLLKADKAST
jgi:hypothetical protein